jgi:Rod binding domain-containing protein
MSVQPTPATGLPVVDQALEPKWVRDGSAATQSAYDSAIAFEQTLVEQLSKSLTAGSGLGGESAQEGSGGSEEGGSASGDAGASELSSMLPQALATSVMDAGGLGLAAQMTQQLAGVQDTARTHTSGATGAVAGPRAATAASEGTGAA